MLWGWRVRVGSVNGCGIRICLSIWLADVLLWAGARVAVILYNDLTARHSWAWFLDRESRSEPGSWCWSCKCVQPGHQRV